LFIVHYFRPSNRTQHNQPTPTGRATKKMAQKATPRKATPERELPTLSKKDTRKKSTPMKAKPKERHLEKGKGAPIGPSSSWVRTADEPIFLIRASCRVKYSESFRFTPRSERRLTAKSIRKRKVYNITPRPLLRCLWTLTSVSGSTKPSASKRKMFPTFTCTTRSNTISSVRPTCACTRRT